MTLSPPRPRAAEAVENLDLSDLVALAKEADHGAWRVLYQRAYPGLMAFASRRLDHDRARDAVAETMARAVANIDKFTLEGGAFDSWLFGILRHVIADVHRAHAFAHGTQRGGHHIVRDPSPPAGEPAALSDDTSIAAISFASQSANLTDVTRSELDQIAKRITDKRFRRIELHAFATGSEPDSRKIALARALVVRSYLIDRGLKSRIEVSGFAGDGERVDILVPNT